MHMEHTFGARDAAAPPPLHLGSKFGFSVPNSAVGSPRVRAQDDRFHTSPSEWAINDADTPSSMWSSVRMPTMPPPTHPATDPLLLNSNYVLSSSPDDTTTPLHAETSVALVLGDDEPRASLMSSSSSASLSGRSRGGDALDAASKPPLPSFPSIDHDLASRVRSMTLPVDLKVGPMRERTGSVHHHPPSDMPSSPLSSGSRMPPGASVRKPGPTPLHSMYPRYAGAPSSGMASPTNMADPPDVATLEQSLSPRLPHSAKRRDDNKWFGWPGSLRLGETVPATPPSVPALEDEATSPPGYMRTRPHGLQDVHSDAHDGASMRRRSSSRARLPNAQGHTMYEVTQRGFHRRDDNSRAVPAALHEDATHWELRDVRGQLAEFSMDQHGSRLIQEKLDHCTPEERTQVFDELFPESRRLMADVFGNYVIQKLLEYGTRQQVRTLGEQLEGHVLSLSLGTYGCRVVQKAFERVDEDQKIRLGQELHPHVLDCVRDQNANHVIQKILEQVPSAHLDFIASAFHGHVQTLASHCYSCRVLQRIFAYCSEDQRRPLLDEMHKDTLRLMQDQYGNYVVQWVLQHGEERDRLAIVRMTKTHLLALSRHKFASNVVEHVIQVAQPADLADLLEELLAPLSPADAEGLPLLLEGTTPLCIATVMMQDQYANYVLQRFLQTLHGTDRERLVLTIRPVLYALRQRQALLAAQSSAASTPYTGSIRIPGGGHIGNKPLQAIERLIEQGP